MSEKSTLLIVDDDELSRDMLGRRLERAGYEVVMADDGEAAMAVVATGRIDLVLLDVMMPGLSGFEVLGRLREAPATARLPVILVSAKAQSNDVVEGLGRGADDYVTKPVDMAVTLARIRTQLARRRAELALSESEERYALAVRGANDGVWDWRVGDGSVHYSPRWAAIMGYEEAPPPPTLDAWLSRVHPDDADRVRAQLDDHLRGRTSHLETEHRIRRGDTYRWVLKRGLAVRDPDGCAVRLAGSLTDITEGKVADALTGLPNRILFNDRLSRLFEHARSAPGFQFALLFLDLDHFKNVKDGLGHTAGDQLLVHTARRLERNLRTSDSVTRLTSAETTLRSTLTAHTVARFGGDEFAIVVSGIRHPTDATRVAERLTRAVAAPVVLEGQEVSVTASIGIALSKTGYERAEDMLRDADIAMYRAKANGSGRYELFDEEMREEVVHRLRLESDLRYAIERKQFVVFYQQIVNLLTGAVIGHEALLRWQHPVRGLVLPGSFIPVAEETGIIVDIGYWVIGEVARQIAEWTRRTGEGSVPTIAINVSARQLAVPDFVERACQIIDAAGVARRFIEFEITETAMMIDPDASRIVLQGMKAAGFRLSIDDFGTGHCSLNYLQRFPVDRLKLDRSFLAEAHGRPEVEAVMRSVVMLANQLNLEVVAEGIETEAQLDHVRTLRFELGQGFYFSRPAPATQVPGTPTTEAG